MSDIATEFIPTNKKDKNSCLMEYKEIEEKKFNFIHEWEESYKSKIYYAKKGDHKYVIKVKNLDPMTEWNKKRLTKEINLSKLTSEKGLSPKIHNVFFCKNEKGKDRLFIVMDKINGGDLGEYLKENKLSEKEKEMIKDLINKLFENDIYLNYLSKDNILVELDDKKKIKKLYLAGLGNLSSAEDLRKEKKELLMEDIEFLSDITENSKIDLCVKDLVYRKIIDIVN
jgi:tRNA A-37 threonylcarbamoyl transferase component Bud32